MSPIEAANKVIEMWDQLNSDDFYQLTRDDWPPDGGWEIDGCAVWVHDGEVVAFRQVDGGPEEWATVPAPPTRTFAVRIVPAYRRQDFDYCVKSLKYAGATYHPAEKVWMVEARTLAELRTLGSERNNRTTLGKLIDQERIEFEEVVT